MKDGAASATQEPTETCAAMHTKRRLSDRCFTSVLGRDQHFFVKILLLDETTGSAFFSSILSFSSHLPFLLCLHSFLNSHPQSFNYIFCVKDYKSAPLHTTVLKHWCQNLNFLLNPSHLICLWLAKLNTSEVKFNLLPSNHVFLFLFLLSLHLGPSYPILFVMS